MKTKVVGIKSDNAKVFEYEAFHVPEIGDVVVIDNVKYDVIKRFWLLDDQSVVLMVEWA